MKIDIETSREVKSTATSVMMSMVAHVAFIVTFALIFWPASSRPSFSFVMQQPENDMETSFESLDSMESVNEMLDETVFEPTELLTVEEPDLVEIPTATDVFDVAQLGDLADLTAATAAPPSEATTQSALTSGFFGIQPTGNRVVYVIDISVSMAERNRYGNRYQRAVQHVMFSVEQLKPEQEFFVYLFCFENVPMRIGGSGQFCSPTKKNIAMLRNWLDSVNLGSGTDPRVSLVSALQTKPSTVFLLSDGEFNGMQFNNGIYRRRQSAVELSKLKNTVKCPIHTIGLEDTNNQLDLKQISEDSGGNYKFVPAD